MNFPENCLRGIQQKDKILEDGFVATDVFYFDDNHVKENGDFEQSINWEDDEGAIPFTLAQKRSDNSLQFRGGVAILSRADSDRISKLPAGNGLSYERQKLDDNPYHGNLVLTGSMSKVRRRAIAGTLAVHVVKIIPQPEQ